MPINFGAFLSNLTEIHFPGKTGTGPSQPYSVNVQLFFGYPGQFFVGPPEPATCVIFDTGSNGANHSSASFSYSGGSVSVTLALHNCTGGIFIKVFNPVPTQANIGGPAGFFTFNNTGSVNIQCWGYVTCVENGTGRTGVSTHQYAPSSTLYRDPLPGHPPIKNQFGSYVIFGQDDGDSTLWTASDFINVAGVPSDFVIGGTPHWFAYELLAVGIDYSPNAPVISWQNAGYQRQVGP